MTSTILNANTDENLEITEAATDPKQSQIFKNEFKRDELLLVPQADEKIEKRVKTVSISALCPDASHGSQVPVTNGEKRARLKWQLSNGNCKTGRSFATDS